MEELLNDIESYGFECEGGPLAMCVAWMKLRSHLSQPQPVAQGEFSVQVTAEHMEEVITSMQGPDGEACAGTLWVGRLDDCGPDGSSRYGIHISCNECPEEGSVTLAEFDAPKVVAQGEAVALDAPALVGNTQFGIGVPWASVISCAQRRYLHKDDPVLTQEQIAEFREALIQPTIPTGHRVVPDALPDDAVIFGDDDDDGYRMGWNACRKAMLAAAPDAGGA